MPRLRSDLAPSAAILAARIRSERVRLGLTQDEMAGRLGIKRATYRHVEVSANPQLSTVFGLVMEGGMDARALLPELFEGPP